MPRRPFCVADVFDLRTPGSPVVSVDGSVTAFTISETLVEENKGSGAVYVLPNKGGAEPQLLVAAPASDPKFSPDGRRLSFLRGGQVWAVGLALGGPAGIQASGEPAQISRLEGGLGGALWANNSYEWSPDSAYIAVVARGVAGRGYDTTAAADDANTDMLVVERTFYKWNAGWNPAIQTDGSYTPTHIWIVPTHIGGGNARCLTDGDQDDHSVTWSPDSTEICFVSNRTGDWDNNGNNSLFAVSIESGATRRITDTDGPEFQPVWSPDGEWIACLHSNPTSKDSPAEDTAVCVVPAAGGPLTLVSTELDQRCGSPQWSHHSKWIYFTANAEGNTHVYRVRKTGGEVVQVTTGERSVGSYALVTEGSADHRTTGDGHNILVCTMSSHSTPPELYRFGVPSGDAEMALTAVSARLLAEVETQSPLELRYESFDGTPIQGWVMPPYGGPPPPARGEKVPAVLMIHGGPHGSFGSNWSPRTHIFSGDGYAVIYLNPRGSTGYGQQFTRGCVQVLAQCRHGLFPIDCFFVVGLLTFVVKNDRLSPSFPPPCPLSGAGLGWRRLQRSNGGRRRSHRCPPMD